MSDRFPSTRPVNPLDLEAEPASKPFTRDFPLEMHGKEIILTYPFPMANPNGQGVGFVSTQCRFIRETPGFIVVQDKGQPFESYVAKGAIQSIQRFSDLTLAPAPTRPLIPGRGN